MAARAKTTSPHSDAQTTARDEEQDAAVRDTDDDPFFDRMEEVHRLIQAKDVGRHAIFWEVGEGLYMPDGSEEISGSVLAADGRKFCFWLGWDEERQEKALTTWIEGSTQPDWEGDSEYERARRAVGLA